MALDSLGLGLTLDTSLLEKADKTLENMHKNSKLIMQNLERGFTAFNSSGADAITKLSKGLGYVSEALDKIDRAEVSPDFDTKGQEKYIGRMQHLLDMVEKLSKTRGAKFYDPTEIYVTDKTSDKISGEIAEVREHKEELSKLLDVIDDYNTLQKELQKTINQTDNELAAQNNKLKANAESYRKLREEQEKAEKTLQSQYKRFATTQLKKDSTLTEEALSSMFKKRTEDPSDSMNKYAIALSQANEKLKKEEEALGETLKKIDELEKKNIEAKKEYQKNLNIYQNRDQIKSSYDILKEEEKILKAELKFSQATQAERAAMLTKKNEAEIKADQKRIRDVQKSYEQLRKEIQKGEQGIADLEASRQTLKESNRPTKGIDNEIKRRRNELNKLMQDELEFRSSEYWPKLQAIDEKFNSKAFEKNQKALAKLAAKESRKDVTSAIQYSRNAQTINEEKEAIKRLVEARDNLSTSTARYKKTVEDINKRILAHKDHIEAVTRVEKEQNTLADSVINRYRKQLKALDEINDALEKKTKIEHKASVADLDPNDADTQSLLARQKTIADDIAAIEKQAQGELDVIKEQHEAERAKKTVDSILKQNEREKQEYAKLLDEKYALEKQKKAMEAAGAKVGDKSYDYMLAQEKELDKKIIQLEQKHQGDIAEIHLKHLDKKNQDEVREFIATQKEKQRIAEEYAKKQREKTKKYGTISSASADRLIGVTENAKNINQHKAAIEKLTQAKSSLDNTDKNYFVTLKKIDKALRQHHKALREAGVESNNLMQSHRGLLNIGGQLARRLALAFSVSQLTQYFRKLVEVRGQFEKTEVALTSIIGDNQKAQKLMNQTIALAIKSPFTLQQLTGYTKQLAAYQVSYEELHSTTKMLADVSAGLGVEMDRLILAFGQVKAANYLRATEVRQFTEAGFNILGELAKYYGELEDRMISVGEVQDMVTKRMVDFEDVAEVFKRVTQEGGRFYEMQSKQAETLAGQWTNLQDRIDVMLNEIGTDREGLLKGLVRMLASLIDNWEAIADVLKIVVGAFLLYKMNLLAVTKSQIANNLATQESIKLKIKEALAAKSLAPIYKNLSSSMRGFGSAMKVFGKANLWVAALTAVIGSITAIVKHVQKMKDVLAEQDKIFNENTVSLLKLSEQYKKASKGADAYNSKINVLQELSDKLEDRNLTLSVKIEEVDKNNIDKVFEENTKRLQKAYDLGKDLGKAIAQGMNEAQGNFLGFSFFGENLKEDAEDYGQSMSKLMSWGMQAQMESIEDAARVNYKNMSKYAQEYFDSIKGGQRKNESDYEWTKRRATALVMISKLESDIVGKNKELQRTLRSVVGDSIELHHETKGVYNNLVEAAGSIANLRRKVSNNPIEMAAQIKTEVDKLDYDPATKQFIINDLYAMLHLKVNYVEDPNALSSYQWEGFKDDLKQSREDLKKFVDENNKSLGYENFFFSEDEIKKLEQFSDALEAIQKKYDENKKAIEQLDGTSDAYSKEEKARLEALQAELKEVAKKWNYDLDKDKGGKGKDERLERLKKQISLIKEMNKEYEKLNKTFSDSSSLAKVKKAYADTAKELDLNTSAMDFTDEGTIKSLEALLGKPEYAANKYVIELQKALDNYKVELGIEVKKETDEELKKQIEDMFDQYDLSIDLKKLNISSNAAKSLFNFDVTSLDELRKNLISMRGKFIGTDMEDEYKKYLEKISDLEDKEQKERFKKYLEYAKMSIGERAKIKMEELTKLKEIEETFQVKQGDSEDDVAYKNDMRSRAIQRAREEAKNAMRQLEWDEFQKTDTFTSLFDDIDNASDALITHMIDKIRDFKDEWKDMPLEDVRTMVNKLNELEVAMAERSPWEAYRNAKEAVKKAREDAKYSFESEDARNLYGKGKSDKDYIAALQIENAYQEQKVASVKEEMAIIEEMIGLKEGTLPYEVNVLDYSKQQMRYAAMTKQQLRDLLKDKKEEVNFANAIVLDNEQIIVQYKNQEKSLKKQAETLGEVQKMANDLYDAFVDLSEALGADEDSPVAIFADMGVNMMNAVLNTIMLQAQLKAVEVGAYAAGTAINSAMSIIGWIVMAIQLVVAGIKAIAKINDNKIVAQLEEQAKLIERQRDIYEQIEERVEKAYSVGQLEAYNKELERSVDLEIQALEASIALEKSRKKADEEQINAWEEEILEARKRLAESAQEMMEEMGGIFDLTDFASGFVDAWWDAMEEGKSGLDALSEHFDETMTDMVKKQALYKGASKIMEQLQKAINASLDKDYSIDQAEWDTIIDAANKANIDLDKFLEGYRALFGQLSLGGEGGLSGLTKGIQGITEDTAQIIEAYLNSIRGYVSEQVTHTKNIYRILNDAVHSDAAAIRVRMV